MFMLVILDDEQDLCSWFWCQMGSLRYWFTGGCKFTGCLSLCQQPAFSSRPESIKAGYRKWWISELESVQSKQTTPCISENNTSTHQLNIMSFPQPQLWNRSEWVLRPASCCLMTPHCLGLTFRTWKLVSLQCFCLFQLQFVGVGIM